MPTCPKGGLNEGGPHSWQLAFQPKILDASASVTDPCPGDTPHPDPAFAEKTPPSPPSQVFPPVVLRVSMVSVCPACIAAAPGIHGVPQASGLHPQFLGVTEPGQSGAVFS